MRRARLMRAIPVLTAGVAAAFLVGSSQPGLAGTTAGHGTPLMHARVTGTPIHGTATPAGPAPAPVTGLPSKKQQIKVLTAALAKMHKNYSTLQQFVPGPGDVFDYNLAPLWKQGIDGAGTTIAVLEGWDFPGIARTVAGFDKSLGLPNPQIQTIFPNGPLPAKCPPGMQKLGSYGSCSAWQGELTLDVIAAHLMAPYAKIVISATPADSQGIDPPEFNVAMPEIMKALEVISSQHLADVVSISDGSGETTYSAGSAEITSQNVGELSAAAAGIPVLVGTGDCGVVQNLAIANNQCGNTSPGPDTAAWDDSPWITAVGGTVPNLTSTGQKAGPDPVWHVAGIFAEGAGYSAVFSRPSYQNGVASITGSAMRSVPDIALDASDGTSQSAPLLNGILALATQMNKGDLGPINPLLYKDLGPKGTKAGIEDVISGNNSVMNGNKVIVPGFTATKGYDVASGWGTVDASAFVPSMAAAAAHSHGDMAARAAAAKQLAALQHSTTLSATSIPKGGTSYLLASNFVPGHPVVLSIDGKTIATLTANPLSDVTYNIDPALLGLAAGNHTVQLSGMLLTTTASFTSH